MPGKFLKIQLPATASIQAESIIPKAFEHCNRKDLIRNIAHDITGRWQSDLNNLWDCTRLHIAEI
jgi:hypothetical protein